MVGAARKLQEKGPLILRNSYKPEGELIKQKLRVDEIYEVRLRVHIKKQRITSLFFLMSTGDNNTSRIK